jgi:TerC family integral membrane protein
VVEKTLSIDNLFVFMLIISSFAVPAELQQRVLLIGIIGALVLRGIFIALGAQLLTNFAWAFLAFGLVLVAAGVKILRDTRRGGHTMDVNEMRSVRLIRRMFPVADRYHGSKLRIRQAGKWAVTPLGLVAIALLSTDVVFAIDSVPAVYGITGDPYVVFVTNAFALLGLRALYFVLQGSLSKLAHLGYGLAAILGFIGAKLVLHWAHGVWPSVPEISTLLSLGVIVGILAAVSATSLLSRRE